MRLERAHSFPHSGLSDEEIVRQLGLERDPLGGTLIWKNPQLLALQMGQQSRRFILSLDKGMGKTVVYLQIADDINPARLLILCTRGAMLRQYEELRKYWPEKLVETVFVEGGTPEKRAKLWNTPAKVYITTFMTFLTDMGGKKYAGGRASARIAPEWCDRPEVVLGDEYHRVLRNRSTQKKKQATHDLFRRLDIGHLILSSGSAANKGPHSLWTALNVCEPKLFSSYWNFVNTYCVVDDTRFGKQIVGVKNVEGFRNAVAPYVFHRKKDLRDYPEKTRSALPVKMEPWQQKIHDELKKNLLTILPHGALLMAPNTLAATTKIRQLLTCPKYLDPSLGYGAGLEGILEDVQDSELSHFVVSTYYTGPIPLIKQFFQEHGFPNVQSLQGGMDMVEMRQAIEVWTKQGGPIIQSIEFAESYELPAAANMYMLGYAHDPERNSQAEDRIHRDIRVTPHPVNIWYVKHIGGYDEQIIEAMSTSADNLHVLLNSPIEKVFNL